MLVADLEVQEEILDEMNSRNKKELCAQPLVELSQSIGLRKCIVVGI